MNTHSSVIRALALLAVAAIPAAAQRPIPERSVLIAVNPLGVAWDIFQVEAETPIGVGTTLGGLASYVNLNDERHTSFEAKLRYYPMEEVFDGFSVGLAVGSTKYSNIIYRFNGGQGETQTRETLTAPTIGVVADFNWFPGTRRRFMVGVGAGAKRIVASSDQRDRMGLDRAQLTGRLVVGMTF